MKSRTAGSRGARSKSVTTPLAPASAHPLRVAIRRDLGDDVERGARRAEHACLSGHLILRRILRRDGQAGQHTRIGELAERRDTDSAFHRSTVPAR
jgi:hypothetical protein